MSLDGHMENREEGLFDFQVNGFAGVDYQSSQLSHRDLRHSIEELLDHGINGIFLTLISDTIVSIDRKLGNIAGICDSDALVDKVIKGIHLEGPYLSKEEGFRGAHPKEVMKAPDFDEYRRLQDASGGRIKLITLAPEWPGSSDFIASVRGDGVSIALGHTDASDREIDDAISAGARFCTHLGNGVPRMLDRHDNVIQRLLSRDELTACLIPDGIHLPPPVLKNLYRAKPKGKVLFTSDCMAAAGMAEGEFTLGHLKLEVKADGIVRLPGSSLFAGSALSFRDAPANLVKWLSMSEKEAWTLCGSDSAKAFGVQM